MHKWDVTCPCEPHNLTVNKDRFWYGSNVNIADQFSADKAKVSFVFELLLYAIRV